jgi:hypothetical protein
MLPDYKPGRRAPAIPPRHVIPAMTDHLEDKGGVIGKLAYAPHFHNRTRLPAERRNPLVFCFTDAIGVHDLFLKYSLSEFDGPFRVPPCLCSLVWANSWV